MLNPNRTEPTLQEVLDGLALHASSMVTLHGERDERTLRAVTKARVYVRLENYWLQLIVKPPTLESIIEQFHVSKEWAQNLLDYGKWRSQYDGR